ncbi:hypothetical protein AURDEDRAFT_167128 [Auricularia subglabra TFB-10046 SS5]|nr:hypothetical protein AURDEDRAFT_167128 [Auricularia subglabra TFB-10046 SS5]
MATRIAFALGLVLGATAQYEIATCNRSQSEVEWSFNVHRETPCHMWWNLGTACYGGWSLGPLVSNNTWYNEPDHNEPCGCIHTSVVAGIIGPWDHSYKALSKTKECVICIPGADLAQKVVDIGNCKGDEVDKFDKFGLTAVRAGEVGAPLIEECLASIECRVHDKAMERKYHMWIFEAVGAWVNEERGEKRTMHHKGIGNFALDGEEIDLRDRMLLWKEYQDD